MRERDNNRYLIVNADDFGHSAGVNAGVIKAIEEGIVTSASLLVRWPAAGYAASYARKSRGFSLGLHVDLGEWNFNGDEWMPVYEVVALEDQSAVEAEVRRQLELFRSQVGRDPTHLDSHQHVHTSDAPAEVLRGIAEELGNHLRLNSPSVRYSGDFYGQTSTGAPMPNTITVDRLIEILEELPPGITELGCHPGEGTAIESSYREERQMELEVLCDPRVREAVERERIVLCSFPEVAPVN